jgi:predicted DNA binding protein
MFIWCNNDHDIIEIISVGRKDEAEIMEELKQLSGIVEQTYEKGRIHLIVKQCACQYEGSITQLLDEFSMLQLHPVVHDEGWEYYRAIVFHHEDIDRLFQRFDEKGYQYEIIRKAPFEGVISSSMTLTADALFSSLTEKQLSALVMAYSNGYYQFPRQTNVKDLAAMKKVPRTIANAVFTAVCASAGRGQESARLGGCDLTFFLT